MTKTIFVLRQLLKKHRDKRLLVYMVFIDLEKAYNWVPRLEIWRCMNEKSVPEWSMQIVQNMHDEVRTQQSGMTVDVGKCRLASMICFKPTFICSYDECLSS